MGDDFLFKTGLGNLYVSVDGEEPKPLNSTPIEFNPEVSTEKNDNWIPSDLSGELSISFKMTKRCTKATIFRKS